MSQDIPLDVEYVYSPSTAALWCGLSALLHFHIQHGDWQCSNVLDTYATRYLLGLHFSLHGRILDGH